MYAFIYLIAFETERRRSGSRQLKSTCMPTVSCLTVKKKEEAKFHVQPQNEA
jgi:hypothetical protein